jgi:hypothetical protein
MRRLLPLLLLTVVASASCAGSTTGSEQELGTVRGTVLLGPMCPVEIAGSPCPDEPLAGVTVRAVFELDIVVATAESDVQGRFSFDLAPGAYVVLAVPEDVPARTSTPVDVTVVAGETTEVTVPVDSGIR